MREGQAEDWVCSTSHLYNGLGPSTDRTPLPIYLPTLSLLLSRVGGIFPADYRRRSTTDYRRSNTSWRTGNITSRMSLRHNLNYCILTSAVSFAVKRKAPVHWDPPQFAGLA